MCRALSSINHCRIIPYVMGMYFCRVPFPLASFWAIASLSSERNAVNKSSALTMNVFRAVRSPKLLLKETQALSSMISIVRWKRWGKLSTSVVRAAAANSNKGSPIGTWPRITSGFTSNCSAVHLLKQQPRVGSCDRAEARAH